jgi:hypothetical protein
VQSPRSSRFLDDCRTDANGSQDNLSTPHAHAARVGFGHSRLLASRATPESELFLLASDHASAAWTAETLAAFDRLWDKLTDDNRARLVGCLVQRVVVNEGANSLRIELVDHSADVEDAA